MSEIDTKRKASFEDSDLRKKPVRGEQSGKGGKKSRRILLIAVAALVLVGGGTLLLKYMAPPAEAVDPDATTAAPSISIIKDRTRDDVQSVTVETEDETLVFHGAADDGQHELEGYAVDELDQNRIDSMLYQASGLAGQDLVEESPADLSMYGLDRPRVKVTVAFHDGGTAVLHIGDELTISSKTYVMLEGDPNVYTAYTSVLAGFTGGTGYYMALTLPTLTLEAVNYVQITTPDQELLLDHATEDENLTLAVWKMRSPWEVDCNSENMSAWLEQLVAVSAVDYAGHLDREDPAEFGLDTPSMRLVAKDTNGVTLDLTVGDIVDGKAFVHETGKDAVLRVDAAKLEFAAAKPITLVDRFVNIYRIDNIDAYTLSIPGRDDFRFTIERARAQDENGAPKNDLNGNPVYDETFFMNGKEIPDKVFRRFYQVVIGVQLDGWQEHAPENETPDLTITYRQTEGKGERVTRFLPYDRDFYAVDTDGVRNFVIRRESVQRILTRLEDVVSENYESFDEY